MTADPAKPAIGFIGLGGEGLAMAIAIAGAGYPLHVQARHAISLDALGDVAHIRHDSTQDLAAACEIVGLFSTDEDVMQIVTGGLLGGLRPGSVVVNHGTGTPRNAHALAETCAPSRVEVLDAPITGGRPAAEAHTLTTIVGGPEPVARRCEPVFRSFSAHVEYMGGPDSGQTAKLFNNALLMMNQASIADIVELAVSFGMDPRRLVEVLKLGSAASNALAYLNGLITLENVGHLAADETAEIRLFGTAMTENGVNADAATARGLAGATRLPDLMRRLNPSTRNPSASAR
jgi:3-hydroxyisobutyrate dehydrogenase-like beta-hydroxyacid dehydrogenase